ncbi:response regulator transcription factor [Flammeovirga agarivorans]|uniref:Response regulator transcription factor n=1 Tax=Flammeovirga agarivorans TaxID=2726742 RepID=A0A7X8SP48_9BACT|nr:response regulator transcription factor [Flammeovirga agarivorans]NLR93816.1 response regulator transcription factor [Flammeovirga agarivorans]
MKDIINVALVDDEALFIEGISLIFSNVDNINVITTANNGLEFLEYLDKKESSTPLDIAIIDIQMKPMDGFELVESIKDKYQDLKVIVLSSHYKSNIVGHMIKLGVSAFIPKNANKQLLVTSIESVHQSGIYFTESDKEMLIQYMNSGSKKISLSPIEELSGREIEVVKLICQENTNQEIAEKLFLSKRTIENHRQRILDKVGAKNTVGLVVYAIANQIHPLP